MKDQETISYMWTVRIPELYGTWIDYDGQSSKVVQNCDVSLQLYRNHSTQYSNSLPFKARILKSNSYDAEVTITFSVNGNDIHTAFLKEWKEFHEIPSFTAQVSCGLFVITCQITWYIESKYAKPEPSNLHDDMKSFHMNRDFSDVVIIVEGEELPAHKIILAACSPVLFSMLTAPMKEAAENRIVIEDVTYKIMKIVLNFMYEGATDDLNNVDVALDVLVAADKYDMEKLKDVCGYKLYRGLTNDKALEILSKAHDHNALKLKEACMDFIRVNKTHIVKSIQFEQFCYGYPMLVCNFMRSVIAHS